MSSLSTRSLIRHVKLSLPCSRCLTTFRDRYASLDKSEVIPASPVSAKVTTSRTWQRQGDGSSKIVETTNSAENEQQEYSSKPARRRAPKPRTWRVGTKPQLQRLAARKLRASWSESSLETEPAKEETAKKPRTRRVAARKEKAKASESSQSVDSDVVSSRRKSHDISALEVVDIEPPEKRSVARLAHGLDRVLFNPGVYYLQDPRSHVYNFDPYLQTITPVEDFNFDALTAYITSSRDATLDEMARNHNLQVVGSTSSMTGVLAQFHYFISAWRPVSLDRLSSAFKGKSKAFTPSQRAPASIYLRHNDGIYAIDADKSMDSGDTVLSFLGRSMEKMLTLSPEEFSKLKKSNMAEAPVEKSPEAYHYSKIGKMLMRSQLDCHDPRLPGTGTFDLKTRAVLPVRMDAKNAPQGAGYQIFQTTGLFESFEREYYDMIRAAFLKYSMQVRIGKMDGIFVAFHNTERIFGFQYISLEEMDSCIHGSSDKNIAGREYLMSLKQLDKILNLAIAEFPGQSMALSFEAVEDKSMKMRVVIEPLTDEEIENRQKGELLEALRAAQRNEAIKKMPSARQETNSKATLEKMSTTLEQMIADSKKQLADKKPVKIIEKKHHGHTSTFTEEVLEVLNEEETTPTPAPVSSSPKDTEADSQEDLPAETTTAAATAAATADAESSPSKSRIMFTLTGTNLINGKPVTGVPKPELDDTWQFKFSLHKSTNDAKIDKVLEDLRDRQAQAWTDIYESAYKSDAFLDDLRRMSDLGRIKLEAIKEQQSGSTPVVFRESNTPKDLEEAYRKNFS